MADQGTGITVTWDSSFLGALQSMNISVSRGETRTSTFATTGGHTYEPSDLVECELSGEILMAPGTTPNVLGGAPSSLVLTYSNADGSTWTWATAFMRDFEVTGTLDQRVLASVTIRCNGLPTIVASP